MTERKTIQIVVNYDRNFGKLARIPYDIDEMQLKGVLRDLGFIPSYQRSYLTTKVYLKTEDSKIEICKDEYRSLEELGVKEHSVIIIVEGEPEPRPIYYSSGSGRYLYGCPMAKSVEEAILVQAEMYSDDDSIKTTGVIGKNKR